MHYSVQQGVQRTTPAIVTSRNWLPTAVAAMTAVWVGLLFVSINQKTPMSPGVPSTAGQVASTALPMATVANMTVDSGHVQMQASPTSGSTMQTSQTMAMMVTTNQSGQMAVTMDTPDNMTIGGYGGDEPTPGTTDPVVAGPVGGDSGSGVVTSDPSPVPVTPPSTPDPVPSQPSNDGNDGTGATITTPVTGPITIDVDPTSPTPITTSL